MAEQGELMGEAGREWLLAWELDGIWSFRPPPLSEAERTEKKHQSEKGGGADAQVKSLWYLRPGLRPGRGGLSGPDTSLCSERQIQEKKKRHFTNRPSCPSRQDNVNNV